MNKGSAGPNVSQLSLEIETSRATIMNYIKYLKDARLLNLLYSEGEEFPKKPKQIYVQVLLRTGERCSGIFGTLKTSLA